MSSNSIRRMVSFRQNVAALILNKDGKLLICERFKEPGAWQFPQGGVDDGEALEEALVREIEEEIGLKRQDYKILSSKGGYRYLYPESIRAKKVKKHGNHGQEQTYFLCQLDCSANRINVEQNPQEFGDHKWIKPKDFQLKWLPDFKREVYQKVLEDFFRYSDRG